MASGNVADTNDDKQFDRVEIINGKTWYFKKGINLNGYLNQNVIIPEEVRKNNLYHCWDSRKEKFVEGYIIGKKWDPYKHKFNWRCRVVHRGGWGGSVFQSYNVLHKKSDLYNDENVSRLPTLISNRNVHPYQAVEISTDIYLNRHLVAPYDLHPSEEKKEPRYLGVYVVDSGKTRDGKYFTKNHKHRGLRVNVLGYKWMKSMSKFTWLCKSRDHRGERCGDRGTFYTMYLIRPGTTKNPSPPGSYRASTESPVDPQTRDSIKNIMKAFLYGVKPLGIDTEQFFLVKKRAQQLQATPQPRRLTRETARKTTTARINREISKLVIQARLNANVLLKCVFPEATIQKDQNNGDGAVLEKHWFYYYLLYYFEEQIACFVKIVRDSVGNNPGPLEPLTKNIKNPEKNERTTAEYKKNNVMYRTLPFESGTVDNTTRALSVSLSQGIFSEEVTARVDTLSKILECFGITFAVIKQAVRVKLESVVSVLRKKYILTRLSDRVLLDTREQKDEEYYRPFFLDNEVLPVTSSDIFFSNGFSYFINLDMIVLFYGVYPVNNYMWYYFYDNYYKFNRFPVFGKEGTFQFLEENTRALLTRENLARKKKNFRRLKPEPSSGLPKEAVKAEQKKIDERYSSMKKEIETIQKIIRDNREYMYKACHQIGADMGEKDGDILRKNTKPGFALSREYNDLLKSTYRDILLEHCVKESESLIERITGSVAWKECTAKEREVFGKLNDDDDKVVSSLSVEEKQTLCGLFFAPLVGHNANVYHRRQEIARDELHNKDIVNMENWFNGLTEERKEQLQLQRRDIPLHDMQMKKQSEWYSLYNDIKRTARYVDIEYKNNTDKWFRSELLPKDYMTQTLLVYNAKFNGFHVEDSLKRTCVEKIVNSISTMEEINKMTHEMREELSEEVKERFIHDTKKAERLNRLVSLVDPGKRSSEEKRIEFEELSKWFLSECRHNALLCVNYSLYRLLEEVKEINEEASSSQLEMGLLEEKETDYEKEIAEIQRKIQTIDGKIKESKKNVETRETELKELNRELRKYKNSNYQRDLFGYRGEDRDARVRYLQNIYKRQFTDKDSYERENALSNMFDGAAYKRYDDYMISLENEIHDYYLDVITNNWKEKKKQLEEGIDKIMNNRVEKRKQLEKDLDEIKNGWKNKGKKLQKELDDLKHYLAMVRERHEREEIEYWDNEKGEENAEKNIKDKVKEKEKEYEDAKKQFTEMVKEKENEYENADMEITDKVKKKKQEYKHFVGVEFRGNRGKGEADQEEELDRREEEEKREVYRRILEEFENSTSQKKGHENLPQAYFDLKNEYSPLMIKSEYKEKTTKKESIEEKITKLEERMEKRENEKKKQFERLRKKEFKLKTGIKDLTRKKGNAVEANAHRINSLRDKYEQIMSEYPPSLT